MKLGVLTNMLGSWPFEKALELFTSLGIEMVEIGAGGYPGKQHADPAVLLHNETELQSYKDLLKKYNVEISAISCHGNPVHPNRAIAKNFDTEMRQAVLVAEKLGVHQINTFSGCPGDCPSSENPNWVTCPWPNEFGDILNYQWNDVLLPYWAEFVKFAADHGVDKIGFELHPGFCVYNTESMLRIRREIGPALGANLDPSHLIWQGMDPVAVIRALGDAIFHFHAKDTKVDKYNTAVNGVLDTKPYSDEIHRSWVFRSVGYGNDELYWKNIISNLRMVGYDHAISIEHEDSIMSQKEGLERAVSMLKRCIIGEQPGDMWWV